jgi:hypothetical protein
VIEVYEPYTNGALAATVTASAHQAGSCVGGSIASDRVDAWRCMAGNLIMDPCFSSPSGSQVACPSFQNIDSVTVINLSQALPRNLANPGSSSVPWQFQLVIGPQCRPSTGATATPVNGMQVSGRCSNDVDWFGHINQSVEPWAVVVQSAPGAHSVGRQTISKAWE